MRKVGETRFKQDTRYEKDRLFVIWSLDAVGAVCHPIRGGHAAAIHRSGRCGRRAWR
ncbi:protein of unknown function [Enterobacter cancerogenus]|nr:protein of unknown function [Enterobacter cancerogenus]